MSITTDNQDRSANVKKNVTYMFLLKGVNILISLMYIPLLINSLTPYRYGIWLTITSITGWLSLFDLGLGNGLRNKLTESLAKDDTEEARKLISTTYASIFVIIIIINAAFFIASSFLDWSQVLNVPSAMRQEVTTLISLIFILVAVQFIFGPINSILLALQKPAYSSLITTGGQAFAFGAVSCSVFLFHNSTLLVLALIIALSPILIQFTFTVFIFSTSLRQYRPAFSYIKIGHFNRIAGLGIKFFALQIITIILFQTSNVIIAQNIGQEQVTEYNIAYKYMSLIYMAFVIIVTPYWSASTEAYARGDIEWIRQSVRKLKLIGLGVSAIGVFMVIFSKFVYEIWIGDALSAQPLTLFLALIYFILLIIYSIYGYILNGIGKLQIQLLITSIIAVLFVPTTIFLCRKYGLNGVYLSLIATAFINATWSSIQFNKIANGSAKGIWMK